MYYYDNKDNGKRKDEDYEQEKKNMTLKMM